MTSEVQRSVTASEPRTQPRWLSLLRLLIEVSPRGSLAGGETHAEIDAAYDVQMFLYAPVSVPQLF
jgi:hypothetical protein